MKARRVSSKPLGSNLDRPEVPQYEASDRETPSPPKSCCWRSDRSSPTCADCGRMTGKPYLTRLGKGGHPGVELHHGLGGELYSSTFVHFPFSQEGWAEKIHPVVVEQPTKLINRQGLMDVWLAVILP